MKRRSPATVLSVAAGAVVTVGLIPATIGPAAADDMGSSSGAPGDNAPTSVQVDSSRYATPGGHGNFRWRYSASKKSLCGIYPTGFSYTVRCAAKFRAPEGADSTSKYDAVELGRRGVRRTTTDGDTYPGAKRLFPGHTISVVGIECTAFEHATITCKTRRGAFRIVGGVVQR
ncbi:hypothetical protein HUN08_03390 [Gordonia sp. X0973]|uniref:hypothetical protein n=1 Tax=Gordonia sp. X0973 TaxID=2742602 RepID=UPI000F526D3D|nr:hypothetical protein [Gordonia sp. X0973]QKT06346.1 hypothetical protein HUN08_03390 [Gordonia sp. X0973]